MQNINPKHFTLIYIYIQYIQYNEHGFNDQIYGPENVNYIVGLFRN